jgi:uncharacterized membrane protein (DUF2068 family)
MSAPIKPVAPWEDVVLRLIAVYKFVKAALAFALGLALLKMMHHDVAAFLRDYIIEPLHLDSDYDSENRILDWLVKDADWLLQEATYLTPHKIRLSAYASFFCAAVFALEGTGLYLKKHWAEYMVLLVTGTPLPFEIFLLYHKFAWWKVIMMTGNLLIVAYLIHRLRLDFRNRQAQLLLKTPASAGSTRPPVAKPIPSEVP